jgi:hypothetical protein
MKRLLLIALLALAPVCAAPLFAVAAFTGDQQAVRVLTIPTPDGRGLLLITTPCGPTKAGSVGLWTARYQVRGFHIIPLRSWAERREFLGGGIVNRLVLRVATFRRC